MVLDTSGDKAKDYTDPQTGMRFVLEDECWIGRLCAWFSIFYLICVLVVLFWVLIRTSIDQPPLPAPLLIWLFGPEYGGCGYFKSPLFKLMAYAAIGGGLGGVTGGIRAFILWHLELKAFGARFIFKDLVRPFLGFLLATIVYALFRGGLTVLTSKS